jgi:hypothetical protein
MILLTNGPLRTCNLKCEQSKSQTLQLYVLSVICLYEVRYTNDQ